MKSLTIKSIANSKKDKNKNKWINGRQDWV